MGRKLFLVFAALALPGSVFAFGLDRDFEKDMLFTWYLSRVFIVFVVGAAAWRAYTYKDYGFLIAVILFVLAMYL